MLDLNRIISEECLYDKDNSRVIICDLQLEEALNKRTVFYTELWPIVSRQMDFVPVSGRNKSPMFVYAGWISSQSRLDQFMTEAARRPANRLPPYYITGSLREVLCEVQKEKEIGGTYSFSYLVEALASYLRRMDLIDPLNQTIFKIKDTLLEKLTGASTLSSVQIAAVVQAHSSVKFKRYCPKCLMWHHLEVF